MQYMKGQRVLVLGLGVSGLAIARWCARCGGQVTVADTRETPPNLDALREQLPDARFIAGPFSAALIEGEGVQAVYRSPGLSPEQVAPVLSAAAAQGILVGG